MPDYKESEVSGTQFRRCNGLQFMNQLGVQTRAVVFSEEDVINIGGKHICTPAGSIFNGLTADNGSTESPLIDPVTGQVVGTATYQDVYNILSSLYLATAMARDAQEAADLAAQNQEPQGDGN